MRYLYLIIIFSFLSCKKNSLEDIPSAKISAHSKAEMFYENKKTDSAFKYFNEASSYYLLKKDSIKYATSLTYLSIISLEQGDYYGSEEINTTAIKYLKQPQDNDYLLSIYNPIALSRKNLKDYRTAIIWYNKALDIAQKTEDKITIKNNIAIANAKMKNYPEAIKILDVLYSNIKNAKNKKLKSKILDNLAYTKFLQNSNYNAETELINALTIRKESSDIWGLNASYAHLSDFYSDINKQKALSYAHKMYEVANTIKNPDDKLEALQKIILLEEDHNKSREYFNVYQKLGDSLQTARNKAKNQFALIRYESEKNKANFLKSDAENAKKEIQLLYRNIGILALILALIGGGLWVKKRKKRLEQEKELLKQEKELEVKNTQLKMSKKVHDVVANGIYQVMTKIENQENFDKEEALDELEFVYEKSRDISYEKPETKDSVEFDKKISVLIASFNNDYVKTYLAGNDYNVWNGVSDSVQNEIYQIIRELLVNMKKHSQASLVAFKFERKDDLIHIQYTDNGIGIQDEISQNNGLRNTVSRMETIHGQIIFDTQTEKGLKVYISFPAP